MQIAIIRVIYRTLNYLLKSKNQKEIKWRRSDVYWEMELLRVHRLNWVSSKPSQTPRGDTITSSLSTLFPVEINEQCKGLILQIILVIKYL